MAELIYTDSFIEGVVAVRSEALREQVFDTAELLASFPELGTSNIPRSIHVRYGEQVRKLTVPPFILIYEYEAETDRVFLLGLDHSRKVE